MAKKTPTAITATEVDKHVSIDIAINNLDSVISHAQNVLDKALGNPVSGSLESTYDESCLSVFLDNAEGNVREKIDTLHSQLNQIENILF